MIIRNNNNNNQGDGGGGTRVTGVTRVDRTEGGEDVKGGGREKSIWRRRRRKIVADGTDGQAGTKAL